MHDISTINQLKHYLTSLKFHITSSGKLKANSLNNIYSTQVLEYYERTMIKEDINSKNKMNTVIKGALILFISYIRHSAKTVYKNTFCI